MFSRTLVLTLATLGLAFTTVEAQSRYRFQVMDRNNDGVITRDEWRGSDRSFERHDWNRDGRLSGDEIRLGARDQSYNWEQADHDPNWRERNLSYTKQAFNNLDHNRDGRLTANEWHYQIETFHRIDRDRDNSVSLPEFLGVGYDDDRDDDFDDLDYNNDGVVSQNEWHGGNREFRDLDRNNDGRLSRYEVVGSYPSFNTYDEFANLDYNRNGSLSRAEWHWSNLSFNRADTNRDGIISRREFELAGGTPATVGALGGQATQSVSVNSQQRWTDTGITVRAGEVLTFQSSGQITMSDNSSDTAGVAGAFSHRMAPDAPISGVYAGALIAKIGEYPPVAIGDQSQVTMPVSGHLYLGVNDDYLLDNRGAFNVTIGVQRR